MANLKNVEIFQGVENANSIRKTELEKSRTSFEKMAQRWKKPIKFETKDYFRGVMCCGGKSDKMRKLIKIGKERVD